MVEQLTIFDVLDSQIEVDRADFDTKIKSYVMAAIKNMGYAKYFDYDKTEISISSMDTSDNNKYFPEKCATMRIYAISDMATTDFVIANRFALDHHRKWVEGRGYDHRHYTKWYTDMMTHRERAQPHFYSLEHHIGTHFVFRQGDTWFNSHNTDNTIANFYKWGF